MCSNTRTKVPVLFDDVQLVIHEIEGELKRRKMVGRCHLAQQGCCVMPTN